MGMNVESDSKARKYDESDLEFQLIAKNRLNAWSVMRAYSSPQKIFEALRNVHKIK